MCAKVSRVCSEARVELGAAVDKIWYKASPETVMQLFADGMAKYRWVALLPPIERLNERSRQQLEEEVQHTKDIKAKYGASSKDDYLTSSLHTARWEASEIALLGLVYKCGSGVNSRRKSMFHKHLEVVGAFGE